VDVMKKRFIFDESYIKKHGKKDKLKWLIIGVVALVLILIIIILALANRKPKKPKPTVIGGDPVFELKDEFVIEAGSTVPEVADYFKKLENIDVNSIEIIYPEDFEISYDTSLCSDEDKEKISDGANVEDFACVQKSLDSTATYGIGVVIQDKEYTVRLVVNDTISPILLLKNLEISSGSSYDIKDFMSICVDISGTCDAYYNEGDLDESGKAIDYSKYTDPGTYKIKIYAKDAYDNKTDVMETELKILEPEVKMHTVTFNSDGGSEVEAVSVVDGNTVSEPKAPTRSGYKFVGWYNGNTKFDFTAGITSDITLTAKWTKNSGGGGQSTTDNPNVKSVSLNFKKINLYIGESKTVTATIYPSNATDKNITWSSADTSIATVSNGKITGVKAGTTKVTATAGGKSATVEVVVKDKASTCPYGDANYNTQYILSVNLAQNNCAVDPNGAYNEINLVVAKDFRSLTNELTNMGLSIQSNYFDHNERYSYIRNSSGTGLVGVQITVKIVVIDPDMPYIAMEAEYKIKPDGSREFITNKVQKNGVSLK